MLYLFIPKKQPFLLPSEQNFSLTATLLSDDRELWTDCELGSIDEFPFGMLDLTCFSFLCCFFRGLTASIHERSLPDNIVVLKQNEQKFTTQVQYNISYRLLEIKIDDPVFHQNSPQCWKQWWRMNLIILLHELNTYKNLYSKEYEYSSEYSR